MNRTGPGTTVLLATGHEVLDAELAVHPSLRILGQVLYREAVVEKAARSGAAVVVLACSLAGGADLVQVIYDLRRLDIRVILLAGDRDNADGRLLAQAVGLGVYDLLFDPVRPVEVVRAVGQPAGFAGAAVWLDGNGEQAVRPAPGPGTGKRPRKAVLRWSRGRPAPTRVPGYPPERVRGQGGCGYPAPAEEETPPDRGCALAEAGRVYRVPAPKAPGRLIVFASPRAGVGRSFLAAAFGIWLAGQQEAVALADLDGGRGGLRWNLGVGRQSPGGTLFTHPSGLGIVREGAGRPVELVDELAGLFRTVILTLPAAGRDGALDVLTGASRVFLVATPEKGVLYDVQRELYYYRHLGLDPALVQLVLNRLGRSAKIRLDGMGGLLPAALCTIVPESGSTPEEALRGRRFRRCMEDLGRAVKAGSRAPVLRAPADRWGKPYRAGQ